MIKLREAIVAATRPYFGVTTELILSEYDLPYYDGVDFFDKKHRLNVHYHPTTSSTTTTTTKTGASSPASGVSGTTSTHAAEVSAVETATSTVVSVASESGEALVTCAGPDFTTTPVQASETAEHDGSISAPEHERRKFPVVVFIHGGGWKRGDRNFVFDVYNNFGKTVAAEGFVCVVPSYRLSTSIDGGVRHPSHARDIAHALRWVKDNIERYNGDPDMVFLSGHSAGGHLAALLALDTSFLAEVGLDSDFVKGVVGISGVYDIATNYSRFFVRYLYLEDAFGPDPDVLREASPVHKARDDAPPFLLVNAASDFGLEKDTLRLKEALLACKNNSVILRTYAGTNHGNIIGLGFSWGQAFSPMVHDVCAWLKKQVAATAKREADRITTQEDKETEEEGEENGESTESTQAPVLVLRAYGWE